MNTPRMYNRTLRTMYQEYESKTVVELEREIEQTTSSIRVAEARLKVLHVLRALKDTE